jgi:hypothetical protein
MLEGPFSADRKFIRFMNENTVHFIYLQGPKRETVQVKVDGEMETRSRYVPQLTPETIDEIGTDMMTRLRAETAPREWRCPRVEIWSADKKLLYEYGPGSRFIEPALVTRAVREAQARLGPGMTYTAYREATARLADVDRALDRGDRAGAVRGLERLARLKGLTPAFAGEIRARRERLPTSGAAAGG